MKSWIKNQNNSLMETWLKEIIKEKIQYRYAQDQYFEEMKAAENYRNQIDLLNMAQPYVGTYFSQRFIMKNVLRMSDKDIQSMKSEIASEPAPPQIGVDQSGAPAQ